MISLRLSGIIFIFIFIFSWIGDLTGNLHRAFLSLKDGVKLNLLLSCSSIFVSRFVSQEWNTCVRWIRLIFSKKSQANTATKKKKHTHNVLRNFLWDLFVTEVARRINWWCSITKVSSFFLFFCFLLLFFLTFELNVLERLEMILLLAYSLIARTRLIEKCQRNCRNVA